VNDRSSSPSTESALAVNLDQDVPYRLLLVRTEVVALALALLLEAGHDGARLAQKLGSHLTPGGQRVAADDLVCDLVYGANPDA
jgi:hypothetical protein